LTVTLFDIFLQRVVVLGSPRGDDIGSHDGRQAREQNLLEAKLGRVQAIGCETILRTKAIKGAVNGFLCGSNLHSVFDAPIASEPTFSTVALGLVDAISTRLLLNRLTV
jgi:hypothetical protein